MNNEVIHIIISLPIRKVAHAALDLVKQQKPPVLWLNTFGQLKSHGALLIDKKKEGRSEK